MSKLFEGDPAEGRLDELGLPGSGTLVDAVLHGAAAARSTTDFHPAPYRGYRMWAETTAYLRFELPAAWEPAVESGVELVASRPHGVAIVVTKGNAATASRTIEPQAHYDRGDAVQRLVNGSLDSLFDEGQRPEWQVWFLLHFLLPDGCAAELSRPLSLDPAGCVTAWTERILLPTEQPGVGARRPAAVPERRLPDIEVPVTRRAV
jgi:hypothetical protein